MLTSHKNKNFLELYGVLNKCYSFDGGHFMHSHRKYSLENTSLFATKYTLYFVINDLQTE